MNNDSIVSCSFRDPSAFLFCKKNELCPQINNSYKDEFNCLIDWGLYQTLSEKKLLISHSKQILFRMEKGDYAA